MADHLDDDRIDLAVRIGVRRRRAVDDGLPLQSSHLPSILLARDDHAAAVVHLTAQADVDVGRRGVLQEDRRTGEHCAGGEWLAPPDREREPPSPPLNETAVTVPSSPSPPLAADAAPASPRRGSGVTIVARSETISTASSIRSANVRSYSSSNVSRSCSGSSSI